MIGPVQIGLKKLAPGETPKIDLVGIGVKLAADGDTLKIEEVVAGGGAADAGMLAGDRITSIDGIPLTELGMQTAIARIRGVAGTTIVVAFLRGETPMQVVVTRKALRY